jgi:hypothetical protein
MGASITAKPAAISANGSSRALVGSGNFMEVPNLALPDPETRSPADEVALAGRAKSRNSSSTISNAIAPTAQRSCKADLAKIEKIEASASDADDFDWNTDDSIILREQRATAAYHNKAGELIIRQRASWCDDEDTFVYISPENEVAFMEGLAKRHREG